jgi:LysM repeat protein
VRSIVKRLAVIPVLAFVLLLLATNVALAQPQTYTVVRGDTLWALSLRYRTTVQALAAVNEITNPNLIYVDQVLVIPDTTVIPAPVPPVAVALPARPLVTGGGSGGGFACIRQHESGGNYATNTGNGYYGAYQFSLNAWRSVGGSGLPSSASPVEQDMRAAMLQAQSGWGPWPATSRMCGLR